MTTRGVHCGDGVAWLREAALGPEHAIVTSLPDVSEVPAMGFEGWRRWFIDSAALALERPAGLALFYQSDIKHEGTWVDKGFLVQLAADRVGAALLFHKIVCRAPAGTITFGRPAYAHLLAFSRTLRLAPAQSSADVLPSMGAMTWPRAMGVDACRAVARFLVAHTPTRVVVDPFCGVGTMLAVANEHGLDALGVELSPKRAERARRLSLAP